MKIVGLIVEYNPFHNGHLYHIEESLRITGADKAIVVMSGDFVQRGAPAIMPKHLRTQMALDAGASVVIELPVRYATGSAEFFANGAVTILNKLGCVNYLCFGSECGDIDALSSIADILISEPEEYRTALQNYLKTGISYPLARQKSIEEYLHASEIKSLSSTHAKITADTKINTACDSSDVSSNVLSDPNNILGVEYLKSLKQQNSKMQPFTITRKTSHYHDTELKGTRSSASAIRSQINNLSEIKEQVPESCYQLMDTTYQKRFPIINNDFSLLLHSQLLRETKESLMKYEDMTTELANRIVNYRNQFISIEQFTQLLNSRNITHARLNRVLFHILLNIQKEYASAELVHYIHILGFRKQDVNLLTQIKQHSELPILTKLGNTDALDAIGTRMIQEDIDASNLYETVVTHKFQTPFIHELEKSIVI